MAYFKLTGMHSHRHPFLGEYIEAQDTLQSQPHDRHYKGYRGEYAEPDFYDSDLTQLDESGAVTRRDTRYRFYQGYGQELVPTGPAPDVGVQTVAPSQVNPAGLLEQTGVKKVSGPALRGALTGFFAWMTARSIGIDPKHCVKLGVVMGGFDFAASLVGDWLKAKLEKKPGAV